MLRVFEAFSGVGSQRMALRNIGVEHEVVAIAEIDKYALASYAAIHGDCPNLGDISKLTIDEIPDHDLFTYSFPCQDISIAGKGNGLSEGSNTRSSLLWECKRVIEGKKPRFLLLENVKNLVGKKNKPDFDRWLEWLEGQGYTNYWKVVNAKKHLIPQNRERVFVVSILGEHAAYEFPEDKELTLCLGDLLEKEVDEKYFLSWETYNSLQYDSIKRIYDLDGIAPTIDTMQGGHRQPKVLIKGCAMRGRLNEDKKWEQQIEVRKDDLSNTITTVQKDSLAIVCEQRYDEGLRFFKGNVCGTIRTTNSGGDKRVIESVDPFVIRKLTPRECWRLMGFSDNDFNKAAQVNSNTQLYKQAGNSIVVNVLEDIFKNLFK